MIEVRLLAERKVNGRDCLNFQHLKEKLQKKTHFHTWKITIFLESIL